MPNSESLQIPPPSNWQDFERLCRDLWAGIWDDKNTLRHGRNGQPQNGVDIFGRPGRGQKWAGVQCKGKDLFTQQALSEGELRQEVEKALAFHPPLSEFIIATTGPKDAALEGIARALTSDLQSKGFFSVHVLGWEDIKERLAAHPDVMALHYPSYLAGSRTKRRSVDSWLPASIAIATLGFLLLLSVPQTPIAIWSLSSDLRILDAVPYLYRYGFSSVSIVDIRVLNPSQESLHVSRLFVALDRHFTFQYDPCPTCARWPPVSAVYTLSLSEAKEGEKREIGISHTIPPGAVERLSVAFGGSGYFRMAPDDGRALDYDSWRLFKQSTEQSYLSRVSVGVVYDGGRTSISVPVDILVLNHDNAQQLAPGDPTIDEFRTRAARQPNSDLYMSGQYGFGSNGTVLTEPEIMMLLNTRGQPVLTQAYILTAFKSYNIVPPPWIRPLDSPAQSR